MKYLLQNASVLSVFSIKSHNNLTIEEELKISVQFLRSCCCCQGAQRHVRLYFHDSTSYFV